MRIALRNKDKIAEAKGRDLLKDLLESLTKYTLINDTLPLERNTEKDRDEFQIPNVNNKTQSFRFAVTARLFDVTTVAFYKTI